MAEFEDAGASGSPEFPEYSQYIQEVKIVIKSPKGKQQRKVKDHKKKFSDNMWEFKQSLPAHLTVKHQFTKTAETYHPVTRVCLSTTYTYKVNVE